MSGVEMSGSAMPTAGVRAVPTWGVLVVSVGLAGLWRDTDQHRKWRLLAVAAGSVLALFLASMVVGAGGPSHRSIGLYDALTVASSPFQLLVGLVTQLGDPWFLVGLAVVFYLLGTERALVDTPREGAFVLAVTFGALALTTLLKNVFAFPRPPGAGTATVPSWLPTALSGAFRNVTTGAGYAFPSGHALGSTAVYGALAYRLNVSSGRVRWTAAAILVGAICLSRVALGVHYAIDVTAGVLAGLALLGTAAWAGADRPLRTLGIATLLATGSVVAAFFAPEESLRSAGLWLGAVFGSGGTWLAVRPSDELDLRRTVVASVVIGAIWMGTYLFAPTLGFTVVGAAVASALTVGAPSIVATVE